MASLRALLCALALMLTTSSAFDPLELWESSVKFGVAEAEAFSHPSFAHWTLEEKTARLINSMCLRNGAAGAASGSLALIPGLGTVGALTLEAISSVSSFRYSIGLQISLVAGIMHLRGFDLLEPRSILMLGLVLAGDVAAEPLKVLARNQGIQGAKWVIKTYGSKLVRALIPYLGKGVIGVRALSTTFSLSKAIPLVGTVAGFVADGGMCLFTARGLDLALLNGAHFGDDEGDSDDASEDESGGYSKSDSTTSQADAQKFPETSETCPISW